jgi:hypothetical protein
MGRSTPALFQTRLNDEPLCVFEKSIEAPTLDLGQQRPLSQLPHLQIPSHLLNWPSAVPRLHVDQKRHAAAFNTISLHYILYSVPPGPNMMPQGKTTNNQSVSHTCSVQSRSHFVSSIYTQALSQQEHSTGSSSSVKTRKV